MTVSTDAHNVITPDEIADPASIVAAMRVQDFHGKVTVGYQADDDKWHPYEDEEVTPTDDPDTAQRMLKDWGKTPLQVIELEGEAPRYYPITPASLHRDREFAAEMHREERKQICVRCGGRLVLHVDDRTELMSYAECEGACTDEEITTALGPYPRKPPPPPEESRAKRAEDRRKSPHIDWAIEDVATRTGVGQFYGDQYAGKTLVALDMALRAANRMSDWYGHAIKRHGPVVYVVLEGQPGIQARIEASAKG